MSNKYVRIGTLLKPVGTYGEIKVEIDEAFILDFEDSDHFFVKINGSYVPYFIEGLRETNYMLIKIEEIDAPETAADFNLKDIYLKESAIKSAPFALVKGKEGLVGYTIYDGDAVIGQIQEIQLFPSQIMAKVELQQKSILIPLADQLITNVDHSTQKVFMQLPEGLLDM